MFNSHKSFSGLLRWSIVFLGAMLIVACSSNSGREADVSPRVVTNIAVNADSATEAVLSWTNPASPPSSITGFDVNVSRYSLDDANNRLVFEDSISARVTHGRRVINYNSPTGNDITTGPGAVSNVTGAKSTLRVTELNANFRYGFNVRVRYLDETHTNQSLAENLVAGRNSLVGRLLGTDNDNDGISDLIDVDADGDRLIDISSQGDLTDMRRTDPLDGTNLLGNSDGCPSDGCNGFELTVDINLERISNWTPIGTATAPFNAVFDGGDNTISTLNITMGDDSLGLFGVASAGSEIRNLIIANANITVTGTSRKNVGVLLGAGNFTEEGEGVTIENVQIIDSVIDAPDYTSVGGLAGEAYSAMISGSYVAVDTITGGANTGGLLGNGANATINYSYVIASEISGTDNVGGFIGNAGGMTSTAELSNSYVVTNLTGNPTNVGPFAGTTGVTLTAVYGSVSDGTNLFADPPAAGNTISALQMPTAQAATIYLNWGGVRCEAPDNTRAAWNFGSASQLPVLNCRPSISVVDQRTRAAAALPAR